MIWCWQQRPFLFKSWFMFVFWLCPSMGKWHPTCTVETMPTVALPLWSVASPGGQRATRTSKAATLSTSSSARRTGDAGDCCLFFCLNNIYRSIIVFCFWSFVLCGFVDVLCFVLHDLRRCNFAFLTITLNETLQIEGFASVALSCVPY